MRSSTNIDAILLVSDYLPAVSLEDECRGGEGRGGRDRQEHQEPRGYPQVSHHGCQGYRLRHTAQVTLQNVYCTLQMHSERCTLGHLKIIFLVHALFLLIPLFRESQQLYQF